MRTLVRFNRRNIIIFIFVIICAYFICQYSFRRFISSSIHISNDRLQLNRLKLIESINALSHKLDISSITNNRSSSILIQTPGYAYHDSASISFQNNVYLPRYHLHYCKIDKNMGSMMQAILCFIDDPIKMHSFFFNEQFGPGLGGQQCGYSTSVGNLRQQFITAAAEKNFFDESSKIEHFAIIRHPINRFVSGFIQVCLTQPQPNTCYNCSDLYCFLPKLHAQLQRHVDHRPVDRWVREWHFYPQSWYCDFDRHYDRYRLIRYGRSDRYLNEILQLFESVGVDRELIVNISTVIRQNKTIHDTYSRASNLINQIMMSSTLLEYIYKIYYLDFVWFGYDFNL